MNNRIYVIEHGKFFEDGFYDSFYYLSMKDAQKHLRKSGFKFISKEKMYSNETTGTWALINYLDLSDD